MKKQIVVFPDGKIFGNGNDYRDVFMNHDFEITIINIQIPNKLQISISE
jgi:hypothetical protein